MPEDVAKEESSVSEAMFMRTGKFVSVVLATGLTSSWLIVIGLRCNHETEYQFELTLIVVVAVAVPLALVAVNVYTVVEVGSTISDPTRVDVEKEPGMIVTDDAFETSHERIEEDAEKEEIMGGGVYVEVVSSKYPSCILLSSRTDCTLVYGSSRNANVCGPGARFPMNTSVSSPDVAIRSSRISTTWLSTLTENIPCDPDADSNA